MKTETMILSNNCEQFIQLAQTCQRTGSAIKSKVIRETQHPISKDKGIIFEIEGTAPAILSFFWQLGRLGIVQETAIIHL